ncbi:MAG: helix-turn-helix transcriptional regulator [Blautia sp.]
MYEIFELLCNKNNVTPYRVCKETGLTTATISNWKAGRYVPKQDKLQKIADYFNVSLEYLMTGEEKEGGERYYLNDETAQVAQEIFENKELRALFDVQRNMNAEDLKALHQMALALKRKERGDIDDTGC